MAPAGTTGHQAGVEPPSVTANRCRLETPVG